MSCDPPPVGDRADQNDRILRAAKARYQAHDYKAAWRLLAQIPEPARSADVQRLLKSIKAALKEIKRLGEQIPPLAKAKQYDQLLPLVRRYVRLKPQDESAQKLLERLEKRLASQQPDSPPAAEVVEAEIVQEEPDTLESAQALQLIEQAPAQEGLTPVEDLTPIDGLTPVDGVTPVDGPAPADGLTPIAQLQSVDSAQVVGDDEPIYDLDAVAVASQQPIPIAAAAGPVKPEWPPRGKMAGQPSLLAQIPGWVYWSGGVLALLLLIVAGLAGALLYVNRELALQGATPSRSVSEAEPGAAAGKPRAQESPGEPKRLAAPRKTGESNPPAAAATPIRRASQSPPTGAPARSSAPARGPSAVSAPVPEGWYRHVCRHGGYAVLVPRRPQITKQYISSSLGTVRSVQAHVFHRAGECLVVYIESPQKNTGLTNQQMLTKYVAAYKQERRSNRFLAFSRIVEETPCHYAAFPGVALEWENVGYEKTYVRIYAVDLAIYVLLWKQRDYGSSVDRSRGENDRKTFFDSFALVDERTLVQLTGKGRIPQGRANVPRRSHPPLPPPPGWHRYFSREGTYTILMPAEPKTIVTATKIDDTPVPAYVSRAVLSQKAVCSVVYLEPEVYGEDAEKFLDHWVQLQGQGDDVRVVQTEKWPYLGQPARFVHVVYPAKSRQVWSKVFVIDGGFYDLSWAEDIGRAAPGDRQRFFDSFELVEPSLLDQQKVPTAEERTRPPQTTPPRRPVLAFEVKSYHGKGDATAAAKRAVEGIPWVIADTVRVDLQAGEVTMEVQGPTIVTGVPKSALQAAGFVIGSTEYRPPGTSGTAHKPPTTKADPEKLLLARLKSSDANAAAQAAERLLRMDKEKYRSTIVTELIRVAMQTHGPGAQPAVVVLMQAATRDDALAVCQLLDHPDRSVQTTTCLILERLKNPEAIPIVARHLASPIGSHVKMLLLRFGKPAEPAVLKYLTHEDAEVRETACDILAAIGTARSVERLAEMASHDADPDVRRKAEFAARGICTRYKLPIRDIKLYGLSAEERSQQAEAWVAKLLSGTDRLKAEHELRRLGTAAEDALLPHLDYKDRFGHETIVDLLKDCGTEKSIPPLIQRARAVQYSYQADPYWKVIAAIEKRLGLPSYKERHYDTLLKEVQSGDESQIMQAAKELAWYPPNKRREQFVQAFQRQLGHPSEKVRESVMRAWQHWATKDDVPDLIKLLDTQDRVVRQLSVVILGRLKDERALEPFARLLSKEPLVYVWLEKFGPAAEDAVLKYIKHSDEDVRRRVCGLLEKIGTQKSLEILDDLRQHDPDENVRRQASRAFHQINMSVRQAPGAIQ